MKIILRKIRPGLFIDMDAKESILAAGVDQTGRFVVTSGWNGKITTIWHRNQVPEVGSQLRAFNKAFSIAGIRQRTLGTRRKARPASEFMPRVAIP